METPRAEVATGGGAIRCAAPIRFIPYARGRCFQSFDLPINCSAQRERVLLRARSCTVGPASEGDESILAATLHAGLRICHSSLNCRRSAGRCPDEGSAISDSAASSL